MIALLLMLADPVPICDNACQSERVDRAAEEAATSPDPVAELCGREPDLACAYAVMEMEEAKERHRLKILCETLEENGHLFGCPDGSDSQPDCVNGDCDKADDHGCGPF